VRTRTRGHESLVPEGDTVWLAARRMHRALAGEVLTATDFRVPQLATSDLCGRQVLEVVSRGKHMLTRVSGDLTLHTHFRMEGSWHIYRPGQRWRGPDWQVRVVLATARSVAVGYRLPVVELVPTGEEQLVVGHLGPDLLGEDWDARRAVENLLAEPDRAVGEALLDQRVLAGLGNMYRCEVLFLRGVSPWSPVGAAGDLERIVDVSYRVLQANKGRGEQAVTGSVRRGESNYVYARAGKPCRRCRTPISKAMQGPAPMARDTYWCPRCQPERPVPTPAD